MNIDIENLNSKLKIQAGIALHKALVMNNSLPSCINCENYEPTNDYCKKFDTHPPADIIVFSCGINNWEGIIPF